MTDDEIITAYILPHEGTAYTDIPGDRGGPTKFGITLAELAEYRGHVCTAADVEALGEPESRLILARKFIAPFHDWVPPLVLAHVADCAVNHGVVGATKLLQHALGVPPAEVDGVAGPKTRALAVLFDAGRLARNLCAERAVLYAEIEVAHPSDLQFLKGWLARLAEFIRALP